MTGDLKAKQGFVSQRMPHRHSRRRKQQRQAERQVWLVLRTEKLGVPRLRVRRLKV